MLKITVTLLVIRHPMALRWRHCSQLTPLPFPNANCPCKQSAIYCFSAAEVKRFRDGSSDANINHGIPVNSVVRPRTPNILVLSSPLHHYCPACRTTLVAARFRVAVICPIIQVPHCIRVFFYFVWFVFINHIFQFYNELCTYCNILDIYLS